ncbi:hypothetical protein L9F63_007981, partial [Diploptera punctata]
SPQNRYSNHISTNLKIIKAIFLLHCHMATSGQNIMLSCRREIAAKECASMFKNKTTTRDMLRLPQECQVSLSMGTTLNIIPEAPVMLKEMLLVYLSWRQILSLVTVFFCIIM